MNSSKCYLRLVLCKVPSLRSRVEELQASFLWQRFCEADSDVVMSSDTMERRVCKNVNPKTSQIPSETISLNQGYTAALSHLIRAQGIEMESSDWGWDSLSQHRKLPRFHLLDCTWSLEGWSARVRETSGKVDTTRAEVPYIVKDARTCSYVDSHVYHMCIVVECGHCVMSSCLQHQYKNKVIQHHWLGF